MLSSFIDILFPPRENERLVRSVGKLGKDGLMEFLDPKVHVLSGCTIVTLLPYQEPVVRACVLEAKFRRNEAAAKALGDILALYLREELTEINVYEYCVRVLIPVPLSSSRLRERGYNQVELVARHALGAFADLEIETDLIVRVHDTLPQTTLDGIERRQNVRGAFGAARTPDPNITYIVIDDVVTTSATMSEAIRALREAGAHDVSGIALAH